jgi:hypothetical protein
MGGLGLRLAQDHAPAAYCTSLLTAKPLVDNLLGKTVPEASPVSSQVQGLPQATLQLLAWKQGEEEVTAESLMNVTQKAASLKIDLHNRQLLSDLFTRERDVRETARLASVGLPHAGDFLNAVPNPSLGLHLRPQELIAVVRYRLGCPIFTRAGPCPACERLSDVLGDHAMNCGSHGERIGRHNRLRDALHDAAAAAGLGPVKEERFLLPGVGRRPADILIPNWSRGQDTALDVTVINPLQEATVVGASVTAGHALTVAHDRKVRAVAESCRQEGIAFIPMAAESLGGWHKVAEQEIKKLTAALARQQGAEEKETSSHLFQKLSILLQRGNAALFLNRTPDFA